MTDDTPSDAHSTMLDVGAIIHSIAGLTAMALGGLMYVYDWAQLLFSVLMIISAVSAVWISAAHNSWVLGHWLAIFPVIGIFIGYFFEAWGFTAAYICLWLAFLHFIERGIAKMRQQ